MELTNNEFLQLYFINSNEPHLSIIGTGGGGGLLHLLTKHGNSSRVLNGFYFPYSEEHIVAHIETKPEKFNSPQFAVDIAKRAFGLNNIVHGLGLGYCSALYKEGQRDGRENCAYACFYTGLFRNTVRIDLAGFKTRESQEENLSYILLQFLVQSLKDYGELVKRACLIPGSFNPIHDGHIHIYNEIQLLGLYPVFEISTKNVDKSTISDEEADNRAKKITEILPVSSVLISPYATFIEKQKLGIKKFAIGADTFNRIIDEKYTSVEDIESLFSNNTFYVFERTGYEISKKAYELKNVFIIKNNLPHISSTEIRNANAV